MFMKNWNGSSWSWTALSISFILAYLCVLLVHCQYSFGEQGPDIVTDKEKELVAKLRPLVENIVTKDYMKRDEYLVRFLRVRGYNIRRAKLMIEKTMEWRKEHNADKLLLEDFSLFDNDFPIVFDGVDNYGRPLVFVNIGAVDLRKIVLSGHYDKIPKIWDALLETAESLVYEMQAETGHKNFSRALAVVDIANFNLRQHGCVQCLQLIPYFLTTYENNYPDRFYRIYVINTPKIFLPVFELARPFLSPTSRNAIHLLDYDSEKWKEILRSDIPEDQLPTMYGGNKTIKAQSFGQIKKSNPYIKAAFEKAYKKYAKVISELLEVSLKPLSLEE